MPAMAYGHRHLVLETPPVAVLPRRFEDPCLRRISHVPQHRRPPPAHVAILFQRERDIDLRPRRKFGSRAANSKPSAPASVPFCFTITRRCFSFHIAQRRGRGGHLHVQRGEKRRPDCRARTAPAQRFPSRAFVDFPQLQNCIDLPARLQILRPECASAHTH